MKKIILIAGMLLAGCGSGPTGMSMPEQIEKTQACRKAGGRVIEIRWEINSAIHRIECSFIPETDHGAACTQRGGVPILSSWDGTLKDCKFPEAGRKR